MALLGPATGNRRGGWQNSNSDVQHLDFRFDGVHPLAGRLHCGL